MKKKQLVAALAAAFVVSVAGTAFAANPFVDVPAKHWAYEAVNKLAKAGIVDGYGDGTFRGDKNISRYEMAVIVAKAMTKLEKADADQKAMINKLQAEFRAELDNLGVEVDQLKAKAKADSVNWSGMVMPRYQYEGTEKDSDANYSKSKVTKMFRTELYASGNINSDWKYYGYVRQDKAMGNSSSDEMGIDYRDAWISGPVAGTQATLGRISYVPAYGLVADAVFDGVKLSFGKDLKTNIFYGQDFKAGAQAGTQEFVNSDVAGTNFKKADTQLTGVEFGYKMSDTTNVKAAWLQYDVKDLDGVIKNNKRQHVELGFDHKLSKDWTFTGVYAKSNADDQSKAFLAQFTYGVADKNLVGSWSAWANYRKLEAFSNWGSTFQMKNILDNPNDAANVHGSKGYEIGFAYVPVKNSKWSTYYVDAKATDDSGYKAKWVRSSLQFWF